MFAREEGVWSLHRVHAAGRGPRLAPSTVVTLDEILRCMASTGRREILIPAVRLLAVSL